MVKETRQERLERIYQKTVAFNKKITDKRTSYDKIFGPRKVEPTGVYCFKCGDFDYYKIGITKDLAQRLQNIQACCPLPITCVAHSMFDDFRAARAREMELHDEYNETNIHGEWFELTGSQVDATIWAIEQQP